MLCRRCGHSVSVPVGRCPSCGAPLQDGSAETGAFPDAAEPSDGTFLAPTMLGVGAAATVGETFSAGATMGETIGAGETAGATLGETGGGEATGAHAPKKSSSGPLHVGQSFSPRYHIIKVLGVGGMGAVYQAWDAELSVAVALKVIRTDPKRRGVSSDAEKRFKQELLLARQVTHKNVVRIHDLGEIDGIKYITMPYIKGDDLATVLGREGKLPVARALPLARQIAGGLRAAHEAGVVHRDLKPANIMIGAEDLALIMDFGISASSEDATTSGGIVGTLEYMAPEQSTGGAVDGRADIYAFGLILYEMLTGPRLVPTTTTARERIEAMKKRTTEGVPPVRILDDSIPAPLDAIVTRCLERDPAARFATTADLEAALAALDDAGELIPIPARISKRTMTLVSVLVAMLLGGMYFVGQWLAPPPAKAHDPVSVLIADFQNSTGDPTFDRTLEPMLKLALEGAGFISAYDRSGIKRSLGDPTPGQARRAGRARDRGQAGRGRRRLRRAGASRTAAMACRSKRCRR